MGRRLRSFLFRADPRSRRRTPPCSGRCVPELQGDGDHLVRADVRPPARPRRGRRRRRLPVGRGADRPRHHRRHRHLQPPRRRAAARGARARARGTARTVLPTSLGSAFALDGPGEYEVKDVLLTGVRTYRDDAKGATRRTQDGLRRRARRPAHDPPRRRRAPADRGEARRHRLGRHRLRAGRRRAHRHEGRRARGPARPEDRRARCRSATDDADCVEALAKFFHEMGGEPTAAAEARRCRSRRCPHETDHRPPGVARQESEPPADSGSGRAPGRRARA